MTIVTDELEPHFEREHRYAAEYVTAVDGWLEIQFEPGEVQGSAPDPKWLLAELNKMYAWPEGIRATELRVSEACRCRATIEIEDFVNLRYDDDPCCD